ncbi:MAG: hypothetical protein ACRDQC_09415 [Gaiellales bacterium]
MPAFGVAALWLLDRPGFMLVVASPLGWAALILSIVLAALGHVLIARIASVDP